MGWSGNRATERDLCNLYPGLTMLRTSITHHGQPYYDEPVYTDPKRQTEMEQSIAQIFGRRPPGPIVTNHNRVILKWVKPEEKHHA